MTKINVPLPVSKEETPNTFSSIILYDINVPADLNIWNSDFSSTSLFGIDQYLARNSNNIAYSL